MRYLWSPCGEQICLTYDIHFNTMVQSHLQLKTEMGVLHYSRWSCGFNYVIVRQALKWLIVRSW